MVSLQDYSQKPLIDGVKIITPKTFKDDGGEFRELVRIRAGYDYENEFSAHTLQANHSIVEPGVVKAFHLHKKQTDLWYVLGKAIINLIDTRKAWKNAFTGPNCPRNRLVLENQLLLIPPNVAHGIGNPYKERLHMIYFTDQFFDPNDEFRIPWDIDGEKIWEIQNG